MVSIVSLIISFCAVALTVIAATVVCGCDCVVGDGVAVCGERGGGEGILAAFDIAYAGRYDVNFIC